MNTPMSKQCLLAGPHGRMVSWIPARYAVRGLTLRLREEGERADGWEVVEVYNALPTRWVEERSRDHVRMRKATDI